MPGPIFNETVQKKKGINKLLDLHILNISRSTSFLVDLPCDFVETMGKGGVRTKLLLKHKAQVGRSVRVSRWLMSPGSDLLKERANQILTPYLKV